MENVSATVCATFRSSIEQCIFSGGAGDSLVDQWIGTAEDLSLATTLIINKTCKSFMEINMPVVIISMEEFKPYAF